MIDLEDKVPITNKWKLRLNILLSSWFLVKENLKCLSLRGRMQSRNDLRSIHGWGLKWANCKEGGLGPASR